GRRLDRHRPPAGRLARAALVAASGGPRDVRGQGRGQEPLGRVRRGDGDRARQAGRARGGDPSRNPGRRVRALLPADLRARQRRGERLRGAGALAASGQGPARACRVPERRRIQRPDRRNLALDHAPDAAGSEGLASASQDRRQHVRGPVQGPAVGATPAAPPDADQLPAGRLELEIPEDCLISGSQHALANIQSLQAQGISIVIDDFGTRYASLTHLKSLPFDRIKIDHSFVKLLDSDQQCEALVEAIATLGKGLSIPMAAEGIETAAIKERLGALGCADAQGWLYATALSPEDVNRMFAAPPAADDDQPVSRAG